MLHILKQFLGQKNADSNLCVCSPMAGKIIPLSMVNDPAFSEEILGKGLAILPISGKVVAPFHGRVAQMFASNHAISLVSSSGVQVLIHIGIDTVKLNGQHLTSYTQTGSLVQKGDILLEFDLPAIAAKGFEIVSPLIVCNSDNFKQIDITTAEYTKPLDEIIWLKK